MTREMGQISLNDVLITQELSRRESRSPDLKAENDAFRKLARHLAEQPPTMLKTLVAIAKDLCQAGTAGVSLLETTQKGEEFRWVVLAGDLAKYEQGTTPRQFSPCGVCLERQAPQLYSYPARYFTYLQSIEPTVVESLVIPLVATDRLLGTIWIVSHNPQRQFDSKDVRVMTSLADFTAAALYNHQTREAAESAQRLLHMLLEHVPEGITIAGGSPDFPIVANSRVAQELLGKPSETVIGSSSGDRIESHRLFLADGITHPTHEQMPLYRATRYGETVNNEEWVIERADGSRIAALVQAVPVRDAQEQIIGAINCWQDITERKQVEKALRESEERLRVAQLAAKAGTWDWNVATGSVFWSEEYYILYGLDPATPSTYENWLATILESDRELADRAVRQALEQRQSTLYFEFRIRHPVEGIKWLASCSQIFYNSNGTQRAIGISIDITERKQAEAALAANEARLRGFVNANVVGILYGDIYGNIHQANDELLRIVGYTREDLNAGKLRWLDITPAEYLPIDAQAIADARVSGACTPYEKEYIRKNGARIPVLVGYSLVGEAREESVAFVLDLSDRKQVLEALHQSEISLRTVAANLPNGAVFIVNRELRYLLAEGKALAIAGMNPENFVGKTLWEALDPNLVARYEPYFRQALGGEPFSFEHYSHNRYYISHGTPLYNDQGTVDAVLAMSYDISDRKRTELNAEFLAQISQDLVAATCVDEIVQTIGAHLNRYLNISSCAFVEVNTKINEVTINYTWQQDDTPSIVGVYPLREFVKDEFVQAANAGELLVLRDVTTDPRVADPQRYAALNIGAELSVPIVKDGEWKFSLCVFHQAPYDWRTDELELLRGLSERIWSQIERTRTEEALRKSEEEFRTISNAAPAFMWVCSPSGENIYLNDRWYEFTGQTPATATSLAWVETLHPDDAQWILPYWKRCQETGEVYEGEVRYRRRDGEYRWHVFRALPRRGTNGKIEAWYGCSVDIDDAKRAEAKLRASEERLRRSIAIETVGVIFFRSDGQIVDANDAFLRMSRYSREDLQQGVLRWDTMTPPEWLVASQQAIAQLLSTGRTTPYEKEFLRKDGSRWWGLFAAQRLNETENVEFVIDISDRKQSEAALSQSEARFRLMVESAKEYAIFTLDFNGAIASWNSGAERLLGYQEAEILGCNGRIIFTPEDNEQGKAEQERQIALAQGQAENERWHVRKDGSRFWGSGLVMPLQTQAGIAQGFVKILQDRTKQRQADERFRLLYDTTSDLLATEQQPQSLMHNLFSKLAAQLVLDYYYNYIVEEKDNRQMLHLSSYAGISEEVAQTIEWMEFGQSLCGMVAQARQQIVLDQAQIATHPNAKLICSIGVTAYAGQPLIVQGRLLGTLSFASRTRTHFTPEEIDLLQSTCEQMAIALERANLTASLQQQAEQLRQANRLKDEFLAVLSHELRSPLNPILGWTKLLQSGKLDTSKTAQALATIERNAKLQTELIEDLLDVSRILQGKLTLNIRPVDLVQVVEAAIETVNLAATAKAIDIQMTFDPQVKEVLGDSSRLQQVVWNLVSNAVKFTPAGGRVAVRLTHVDEQAEISVSDTGKGIKPQFLPHVFDYFRQEDGATTRQFGGLGLGLAIVRHLVELHGGTVTADSPGEGHGATFTVRLPLSETKSGLNPAQQPPLVTNNEQPLVGIRVLVVDDEADMREVIAVAIAQAGAEVKSVATATEALAALTSFQPDVLLSDIGMPGIDGYMLLRQVRALSREQRGDVLAIALTAYAAEIDQQQARKAGFQRHLAKPIEPDTLVKEICQLLRHRQLL